MKEIKRGEVYYADLSPGVGSEQDGFRPVVIVQNNLGNKHSSTTIAVAITSRKTKSNIPTHVVIEPTDAMVQSIILTEQIRTIDKSRLDRYLCTLGVKNNPLSPSHLFPDLLDSNLRLLYTFE